MLSKYRVYSSKDTDINMHICIMNDVVNNINSENKITVL